MPDKQTLLQWTREALSSLNSVEEKKMFRGISFMVDEKLCICINEHELLCRIGEPETKGALQKEGCSAMMHRGSVMKDYVFVSNRSITCRDDFDYWMRLSLAFNKLAAKSKKKSKK